MTKPRCHNHKDRADLPRLCHTCQRIAVEQEIVVRTVDALLAAGYALQTDIQEDPRPAMPTTDRAAILAEMMDVDDEYMGVYRDDGHGMGMGGCDGWSVSCTATTDGT